MLVVIAVIWTCWLADIYRVLPGWGPIRKFDGHGGEDLRINQYLIHEHAQHLEAGNAAIPSLLEQKKPPAYYGTIGKNTWGVC